MRRRQVLLSAAAIASAGLFVPRLRAQELVNDESAPLFLTRIIPIPDTPGRFDHMSVDNKRGLVFATVFGNDTVEVLQLARVVAEDGGENEASLVVDRHVIEAARCVGYRN